MISIVSLAYNQLNITLDFLTRLVKYTDIPYQLVFTDNGSDDPISEVVMDIVPDATLIVKERNVGCPATRNEAMKEVKTDICFWIDNDTMLGPKWYEPLLKTLENKEVGITGNTTNYLVKNPFQLPYPFQATTRKEVDWFMGWLVGFKTKAYKKINDYNLPVNLDDVELALGVKSKGYKAVVCEPPFANHLGSQTQRGWIFNDQEKLTQFWNNWKDKAHILEMYK